MKLRVLAVGRLKDAGLVSLCDTYVRRLKPMFPTTVEEPRTLEALRTQAAKNGAARVVLDERGDLITTEVFAKWLGQLRDQGTRSCSFLIGDAHGFTDEDRRGADRVLALSPMTLPHRLARLLLLEQLYRAGCVLSGHPYHH
jgi:23S rRNA (pseudouridine1915-N3)-methyltransferase